MTAILTILALVAVGIALGMAGEIAEQRRLRGMADDVRRRRT